jgi:hypothetical protein
MVMQTTTPVIPTGAARLFLACGLGMPGCGVEGSLFDFDMAQADATNALTIYFLR